METGKNKPSAEPLRCETCLYWEDYDECKEREP
jgi:hypothetical protein|nr:MAG TPA: hypothetical protein [Caudoviricetes sp.]